MQIYSELSPLALGEKQGAAVAMGYFDGIHIGHRSVIGGAVEWAKAHGAAPVVFTFHLPMENKMKGKRLISTADKHRLIESLGVEHYLVPDFEAIKGLSAEEFVRGIVKDCHARALFCGENFTFGARAAGDPALLQKLCQPLGVEVHILPMAQFEGRPVSSTRIRAALAEGKIEEVNAMLGEDYCIDFPVRHGRQLGRTLGFPTINQIYPAGMQMPKSGVYITQVMLEDGSLHPGATGLGSRPTVGGEGITCETFLPGFSGQLYGSRVRLRFCRWLKPTVKFDTLAQLTDYVSGAADAALAWFGGQSKTGEANH